MSSEYLCLISKHEKDQEAPAVEKWCFTTSQSRGTETEIRPSKLFKLTLASLNSRNIFLLYAFNSVEIGQDWSRLVNLPM